MQETSALYKELFTQPHGIEVALTIGESGRLVDHLGDVVTFGGFAILVAGTGPESGYTGENIVSVRTTSRVFDEAPSVGNTIAGEIDIEMIRPVSQLPDQARIVPYVRLTDGVRHSEWIQKGVYFIDTRIGDDDGEDSDTLHIHGYDVMLQAETRYPPSRLDWPALDVDVVKEIADDLGVSVDPRTWEEMNHGYRINYPANYYSRTVLGLIGAMYGANWFVTDFGDLRMVKLSGIPKETRLLIDQAGYTITFGGDRIRV